MSQRSDDLLEPLEPTDEEPIEDNEGIPEDETPPVHYQITSYGADYPVDGLVTRIQEGSIYVPTFQRGYVWSINLASRFIESLLIGLPVPGIFLSRDEDTQKLLVIDGQQRLRTLQYFFEGVFPPLKQQFTLRKVQKPFQGATYKSLADEHRRALNDAILHATIVRQDAPSADASSIYQIFERLNTGGIRLSPQEIRTCLYHGELADLLRELNEVDAWRHVFGKPNRRMRDQEMILRFLALYYREPYEEYMAEFLNKYMGSNRHLQLQSKEEIIDAFVPTIELTDRAVGADAFRPRGVFNAAVFDAIMVGVAGRLRSGRPVEDESRLAAATEALLANLDFQESTETGTAHQDSVKTRLRLAREAFEDIP